MSSIGADFIKELENIYPFKKNELIRFTLLRRVKIHALALGSHALLVSLVFWCELSWGQFLSNCMDNWICIQTVQYWANAGCYFWYFLSRKCVAKYTSFEFTCNVIYLCIYIHKSIFNSPIILGDSKLLCIALSLAFA